MRTFCEVGYSATLGRAGGHNFRGYVHWCKVLVVEGSECRIKWQIERPHSHSIKVKKPVVVPGTSSCTRT